MGKYQKNIEAARQISVVQYLETYRPGELVRKTDREYCTRSHDCVIVSRLHCASKRSADCFTFCAILCAASTIFTCMPIIKRL